MSGPPDPVKILPFIRPNRPVRFEADREFEDRGAGLGMGALIRYAIRVPCPGFVGIASRRGAKQASFRKGKGSFDTSAVSLAKPSSLAPIAGNFINPTWSYLANETPHGPAPYLKTSLSKCSLLSHSESSRNEQGLRKPDNNRPVLIQEGKAAAKFR